MLNIFKNNNEKYESRAEILLPTIKQAAISAYSSILDNFSLLKNVQYKDWEFFFSIAAAYIATIGMDRAKLDDTMKSKLSNSYGVALDEIFPEWAIAFKDCGEFFWKTTESLQSSNDARYIKSPELFVTEPIGCWLIINVIGHWPENEEERKLVTIVGGLICSEFIDWWKD